MNTEFNNDTPLYGSRGIDTYINLIKTRYSYINVNELLVHAQMEPYQIKDEGHLFSQKQINLFYEKLVQLSGNPDIAREAGRYAASPESLGSLRRYVLGFIGPLNAYELIGTYANKITKSCEYKSKGIGKNKVEIVATPYKGVVEEPYQCENRMGYWDAVSEIFNYKLPQIDHPECLFKGDNSCRYIVSWQESPTILWEKIRNLTGIVLVVSFMISLLVFSPWVAFLTILPTSLAIIFCLSWYTSTLNTRDLKEAVGNLHQSSDELIEQININYESALLINEMGQALSKELELGNILANIVEILQKRLDYDRGLILLANEDKTKLISKAGFGYETEELSNFMMSSGFHLDKKDSKGVFINCFREQKPYLINNIDQIKDDLSSRSLEFAIKMGVKSFICCPIMYEDESVGILAVDNLKTKKPLLQRDINILMGIANQIGISINNASLINARFKQFQSILQVLAATTDARDPITAGHSVKVTEYSVGICNDLGLSYSYTEMIRVASLLHDYGKIGVDDSILKKPGRLDDNEYEHIKTHAKKTKDILEQINFEGIYKEVPEIAGSHHEKLDGTGYPNNLTSNEIHFGAKIIAVADVFEALTSQRHYRDPMPVNEAFDHLVSEIGIHFDKDCVEALIRYFNSQAFIPYIYDSFSENSKDKIDKASKYNSERLLTYARKMN